MKKDYKISLKCLELTSFSNFTAGIVIDKTRSKLKLFIWVDKMKKLAFLAIIVFGFAVGYSTKIPEIIQNCLQSVSGMSKNEFNTFINKKHYLIKSWAIDPKKMDPEKYKALNETLNYQTTALDYINKKIKDLY